MWAATPRCSPKATFDELPSSSRPRYDGGCEVRMCALLFPATPRFPNVFRFFLAISPVSLLFFYLFHYTILIIVPYRTVPYRTVPYPIVRSTIRDLFTPFSSVLIVEQAREVSRFQADEQPSSRVHRLKMKTGHGCRWCTRFCRTHEAQVLELCRWNTRIL